MALVTSVTLSLLLSGTAKRQGPGGGSVLEAEASGGAALRVVGAGWRQPELLACPIAVANGTLPQKLGGTASSPTVWQSRGRTCPGTHGTGLEVKTGGKGRGRRKRQTCTEGVNGKAEEGRGCEGV